MIDKALQTLLWSKAILEQNNIQYVLDCGSLLWLYRNGQLKDNEDDTDLVLPISEYDKLKKILEKCYDNDEIEYLNIRSRELTIKKNGIKTDFIFSDIKDNNVRLYSYKQNPLDNNKWNWEWIALYPKEAYYPFKQHTFSNGLTFSIPNNIEQVLEIHYGKDWNIPKPSLSCWTIDMADNVDKNYVPIAVVMTTIKRDDILLKILPSYLQYPIKLYLLDQGKPTEIKDKLYAELKEKGHHIEYSHKDWGLSKARNHLLKQVDQEYVLLTEDDIELKTNPYSLLHHFTSINIVNKLGVLGGLLIRQPSKKEQHYEYALTLENGILEYKKSDKIDLVLNFFLAKTEIFKDVLYDNNLLLSEHTDWFLRLKETKKWLVDYTKNLEGYHHSYKPPEYHELRSRAIYYAQIFRNKWNINRVIKDGKEEFLQPLNNDNTYNNLTIFVITHDNEPNYDLCIEALQKQTVKVPIEVIRNVRPMNKAFQEMLNKCKTKYYIQVDSDMILDNNAIETMYQTMEASKPYVAMVCFQLRDSHLGKNIDGIKIYNHEIFKNFPYIDTLGCEMEQLKNLEEKDYTYTRINQSVGEHCPIWSTSTIFERYYNWIDKHKKNKSKNYQSLLPKLLEVFVKNPNTVNLFALLGGIVSAATPEIRQEEKDFTKPILTKFPYLSVFENIYETNTKEQLRSKKLVLQISGSPCANRPYDISQLINTYSNRFTSRHILGHQYSKNFTDIPYREFPTDLTVEKDLNEIIELIKKADIIHVHHKLPPSLEKYVKECKNIIYTVSNIGSSVLVNNDETNQLYTEEIKKLTSNITVTDQPQQKKVYSYLTTKTLPLVKFLFNESDIKENEIPLVVYAPTNRRKEDETSKGYYRVCDIINKLKKELSFNFDLIEGVPYLENLNRKRKADIIIDDVINENFHNTSIEAACFSAVALTNYSDKNYPFLKTSLNDLEDKLRELIKNKHYLKSEQQKMVNWIKTQYTPLNVLKPFEELYEYILINTVKTPVKTNNVINDTIQHKILDELLKKQFHFWLVNRSCLEMVNHKHLISLPLEIGVKTEKEQKQILKLYSQHLNHIRVIIENRDTKLFNGVQVPSPVVGYLKEKYGYDWEKKT